MNNPVQLTFRPHDPYFFGGEQTFGNGEGASYFAKSNLLPQQSTLCGALRHLLLTRGFRRGSDSFHPDKSSPDTGDLLGLSPLFLVRADGVLFLPLPLDRQEPDQPFFLEKQAAQHTAVRSDFQAGWQPAYRWVGYEPKKYRKEAWVSADGAERVVSEDLFIPTTRPGITKVRRGSARENEDGFYKQTAYSLAEGWAFGIVADFADAVTAAALDGTCLPMGAEKTVFSFAARPAEKGFDALFDPLRMFYPLGKPSDGLPRLVLASDAYAEAELYAGLSGGVTETVDFRFINTPAGVSNFAPLRPLGPAEPGQNAQLEKSAKYTLLRRGSVFVAPDAAALTRLQTELSARQPWYQYGFNHFFTIE